MNTLHPLLTRQGKRHFGALEGLPVECRAFVRDVDEAYRELEADRGMLGRALLGDYLSKPLDPQEAQRMLQRWLTKGRPYALSASSCSLALSKKEK